MIEDVGARTRLEHDVAPGADGCPDVTALRSMVAGSLGRERLELST